jgi:tetratricopeptide (TPR) repeat protein
MRWPRPPVGWVACAVTLVLAGGCAAHQAPTSASLAGRLVRGVDGPGGVAWPTAEGAEGGAVVEAGASPELKAELSAGPRLKNEARDADLLEVSDDRLRSALEAAALTPTASALRAVADEYRRMQVFDQAHKYLTAALALEPEDGPTRDSLARLWRDWGLPAEGLPEAYRAVAFSPDSPEALNTLGMLLYSLGHVEAARERFEEILALDGQAAYARTNLCHAALMAGEQVRALEECRAALAIDPSSAAARNNLGLVYAASGRWDEAAVSFLMATTDEAIGRYNLGVALMGGREYLRAAEAFETALRLRPGFEQARQRATEARRLAGAAPVTQTGSTDHGRD